MLKLYDYFRSTACYRVRIALNIKQVPYEIIPIHLLDHGGEQHQAQYLSHNPQALVPTLITHENIALTQSLAIIDYLDSTYPSAPLYPKESVTRAKINALALMIACDIHPLNNLRVLQQLERQFAMDAENKVSWIHHWLKTGFDALEIQLENLPRTESVCYGDQITIADLCLIPQVYNANRYHFDLEPYPLIQKINRYCLSLSAFIKAMPGDV